MILTDNSIKKFKEQLQQSVLVCSERCLYYSVKWATEILEGIKQDMLDTTTSFTNKESHLNILSLYHTSYESSLPPLSEEEYNKYQYAKSLFQLRQFCSVQEALGESKSPKLYFLRMYAKYLDGEKRKEEFTQEVLSHTEDPKAENLQLEAMFGELDADYKEGKLDAFLLYLYGIVLKKRKLNAPAAMVLIESLQKYEFNWSAWMELGSLVTNSKMLLDIEKLLDKKFRESVVKEFFLAHLCTELSQSDTNFKLFMDPIQAYFPNSPYILTQLALGFMYTQNNDQSLILFENLREKFPSRLDGMDGYSNILFLQEDCKEKLCVLALDCEKVDKYRPETCIVRGNYYSSRGDFSQSTEYYKRALKLNKNYYQAWTLLGFNYIEAKEPRAAIECYRRALDINARNFRAWFGLGQTLELMKYYYEALFYYKKATDLKPKDDRLWRVMGSCYDRLNQENEMKFCFKRATECDIEAKATALYRLGKIYENMEKYDLAYKYYRNFWEGVPQDLAIDEYAEASIFLAKRSLENRIFDDADMFARSVLNTKHPYHDIGRRLLDDIERKKTFYVTQMR